eukprot:COSAG03_NODE_90_length_13417_cov_11.032512_15_plen_44_part_00
MGLSAFAGKSLRKAKQVLWVKQPVEFKSTRANCGVLRRTAASV